MAYDQWTKVILVCIVLLSLLSLGSSSNIFLNKWAVEIEGDEDAADQIAAFHGFRNLGKIGSLSNYYLFEHHKVVKRSTNPSRHHHVRLKRDPNVSWVEQQIARKRVKRDLEAAEEWNPHFRDPLWPKTWYLRRDAEGGYDMNVASAWERGYTGKGVVITILDDGIEHSHTDLRNNYDPEASLDINGGDDDPLPRYDNTDENRHGTRCAGEVAAQANNTKCSVGVAYNSHIGGVRMLDGDVSDYVEAQALSLNPQHIDIYSASWGPDDNGKVVDGPAKLAKEAFINGVLKGRGGKGSIYVWASGNGGSQSDSCSCDGYTNSIFTLSVSSASEHGTKPWYLEECASTLATTYSSGENYRERKIMTTDLHDRCTEKHTGTSASAPLAAGMCALALEANPQLSWRDMQFIVLMASRPEPLKDGNWETNGVGKRVSHKYGYGLMDGDQMVELAERWSPVPEQHLCYSELLHIEQTIEGKGMTVKIDTSACGDTENSIKYLEHVQAKISLTYNRRGDLQIHLLSPNGTRSTLLPRRKNDYQSGEFKDWPFMSVFFWGEDPTGTWKLEIENTGSMINTGYFAKWQLILYGTETQPVHIKPPPTEPSESHHEDRAHENGGEENGGGGEQGEQGEGGYPDYESPIPDYENPPEYGPGGESKDRGSEEGSQPDIDSGWYTIYPDQEIVPFECSEQCAAGSECSGPYSEDCALCAHVRLGEEGACASECPETSFLDDYTGICHHCPAPCLTCQGPEITEDCMSCIGGYYLIREQGKCVERCPSQYYSDEQHHCIACSDSCLTCDLHAEKCTSCRESYQLEDHICTEICGPTQYRGEDHRCQPCDELCASCTGPGPHDCLLCESDLIYQNGTCVAECSTGFFNDPSADIAECEKCHVSCKECDGASDEYCIECVAPLKLIHGTCIEMCPEGHYEDANGRCQSCAESCMSCVGPHPSNCSACNQPRLLNNGVCVEVCPVGTHAHIDHAIMDDGPSPRECQPCFRSCVTCTGSSPHHCTSCKEGLLLGSDGQCKLHCDIDEYIHEHKCLPCDDACVTCHGAGPESCTSCPPGHHLLLGHCLRECPQGFYAITANSVCHKCHFSCSACHGPGPGDCSGCNDGYVIHRGQCTEQRQLEIVTCHRHEFRDPADSTCRSCDPSCDTCNGPGINHCMSCISPRAFYAEGNQCLPCCGEGTTAHCCECHGENGVCISYHYLEFDEDKGVPGATMSPPTRPSAPTPSFSSVMPSSSTTPVRDLHPATSNAPSLSRWGSIGSILGCLGLFTVLLFLLLFGLLQARSGEKLCWKHRYQPVPMYYHNGTKKVTPTKQDLVNEDEVCTA